jgi:hypothetical protein
MTPCQFFGLGGEEAGDLGVGTETATMRRTLRSAENAVNRKYEEIDQFGMEIDQNRGK